MAQQQLGHSSIQVTIDTYGSWIRLKDPAAAARLDLLVERWTACLVHMLASRWLAPKLAPKRPDLR
jgi:hypothetical protein